MSRVSTCTDGSGVLKYALSGIINWLMSRVSAIIRPQGYNKVAYEPGQYLHRAGIDEGRVTVAAVRTGEAADHDLLEVGQLRQQQPRAALGGGRRGEG